MQSLRTYTIKAGSHYCLHWPKLYFGKAKYTLEFLYDQTGEYVINKVDQHDINKLFGVSFGYHKKNSVRIGTLWNPEKNYFEVYLYFHENWIVKSYLLGSFNVYELVTLLIELDFKSNQVIISRNNIKITHDFTFPKYKIGYYLYPYQGGNIPAQHDIKVYMVFE